MLWLSDLKRELIGKDPAAGKERLKPGGEGGSEDEVVGWHSQLSEHEFE